MILTYHLVNMYDTDISPSEHDTDSVYSISMSLSNTNDNDNHVLIK